MKGTKVSAQGHSCIGRPLCILWGKKLSSTRKQNSRLSECYKTLVYHWNFAYLEIRTLVYPYFFEIYRSLVL